MGDYENLLRARALVQVQRSAGSPRPRILAMIRYLDNDQNAAGHINENYAREVMELHSLGVDAGYSQKDVQELARVLTGLGTNFSDKEPKLKPRRWCRSAQAQRRHRVQPGAPRHGREARARRDRARPGLGRDHGAQLKRLARAARHGAAHQPQARGLFRRRRSAAGAGRPRMSQAYLSSDGDIAITLQAMFDLAPEVHEPRSAHKFKDLDALRGLGRAARLRRQAHRQHRADAGLAQPHGPGPVQPPDARWLYPMDQAAWASSGQLEHALRDRTQHWQRQRRPVQA